MKRSNNSILITGGGSGIGLAMASRFLSLGNEVIICGRNLDRLEAAKRSYPALKIVLADIAKSREREILVQSVLEIAPLLNVLVNNAGIQRRCSFSSDNSPWVERAQEIAINIEAPLHLTSLFLPHLSSQPESTIINVTSGLAFLPVKFAPVYAATKAALHSFTVALRADLADSSINVVEVIPPAVNTDLGGAGNHGEGVPVDDFADAIMERLFAGECEIGYGQSEMFRQASREELAPLLARINK